VHSARYADWQLTGGISMKRLPFPIKALFILYASSTVVLAKSPEQIFTQVSLSIVVIDALDAEKNPSNTKDATQDPWGIDLIINDIAQGSGVVMKHPR
jgi:hypothetical protein